ncbi:MAG: alpha/beta hydrolase [Clostridiales bacterium]|nr:alpha/beta hydrolase [Clostridiales bacterium]
MKNTTRGLITAAGAAACAAGAVRAVYNRAENLADMAMNRTLPEKAQQTMQAVPGSEKEQDIENRRNAAADRLRQCGCETVEIQARDGIRLIGHFRPADNPGRTVVAVHGWRSSWAREYGLIADFFRENGCNVLYIEQRAHGESDGDYIGFGLSERYDVMKWIDWVNGQPFSGLPVYLFGRSMGAATVLMTAGMQIPDSVHGVIADSGYTSPREEWKYVAENNLHYRYKWLERYVNRLSVDRIGFLPDEYSSTEAMKACKTPVLFIHGTDDTFVPIEMTYENYKACAAPKRLLIVPGAGHCQSHLTEPERYEKELLQFWGDFDQV